jgi:hypothetical protein
VLARLVDRSLVVLDDEAAEPRYRLLESVAAFCLDRLDDPDAARARHAAYYTELAERADPQLRGAGQGEWLRRLDAETANLRAALGHGGDRLVNALTWYWFLRGRYTEAHRALAGAGDAGWRAGFALLQGVPVKEVELPAGVRGRVAWFIANALMERSELARATEWLAIAMDGADRWTEAAVLATRAMLAHAAGDLAALERDSRRSDELFAAIGDHWGRLQANDWIGGLAEIRAEYDRAAALHAEGLRWAEELALWPHVGGKLSWLAWIAVQTGDYPQARELGERAYRMAAEQNSTAALAFAELSLGFAARRDGKLDLATAHLEHLVEMARREEQPALYLPMVLVELGYAAEQAGDLQTALARHVEAFDVAQTTVPDTMVAPRDAISALEGVASAVADPRTAAELLGAAAAARADTGIAATHAERNEQDRITARLVAALGEDAFAAAHRAGGGWSLTEAMRRAGTKR